GFLYVFLKKQTPESVARRLSGHVYDSLLALFLKNIPFLGIITLLAWIFYSTHIPFANYALLAHIVAVFLLYRIVTFFARFILLERSIDESGSDVRLYQRLMWLFRCGALLSACLLITEELPLPLLLQDLFHRLLMLYLCVVAIVLWRSKEVITHVLRPFLKGKKRYFQSAVLLVVALLPITLLTTAVVGLIGYINLAWTMGAYQAEILSLLSVYVLLRGLLLEALDYISEWMVDSLYNGWLWTEVFLKPFDKIARLSLFGGLVLSMGVVFNLHADSPFVLTLINIAHYPFVDFSGIHITSVSVVEFIILSCFLAWTAKWAREFSYRWLYRHTKDTGIRNSLAVFTQYGIIAIGGVIALHVLGFDFSGLSMILGGLAVGMGFGLRDFASNIVGGLMLLIERPVREGDLITLGDYEGRVAHIGIRSMRVSSWDNMEVLIPNAETFNKPFTNWTHQDSIVRTVVPFKVSRADDPLKVQALIFEVLIHTPEVLKDPIPQVFLTQIDEVLIQFEARYFINVELYTRFEVRSNILFKIMELFEKEGIQAPIPQMKVNLGDEPFGEECTHG
ncbi:MAG: mechanosensitive ion channel, partial [Legionellaceae bacterium]|nr:mechanosensitive ion channel [Legionellaceae bacterium]